MFTSKIFVIISGMWMVIVGYSIILLPLANLIYFLLRKKGIRTIGSMIIAYFIFVFTYGSYLAWTPTIKTYDIQVNKESVIEELTVLLVSDLHLGKTVGKNHLQKLVDITKKSDADMILMPGDIINDDIEPFLKQNMGELFAEIRAPLGVYVTSGNHDYYGGDLERLFQEMDKAGVTMLDDEVILIEDSIYIVGRNDSTDEQRKSIEELIADVDLNKPVIMLDHQPTELDEASKHGVDIIVSGHTHRGQIWPANLITQLIYENDYGHLQKDNLHSIVTSGFGLWGPPFRLGSQAEVIELNITFVK